MEEPRMAQVQDEDSSNKAPDGGRGAMRHMGMAATLAAGIGGGAWAEASGTNAPDTMGLGHSLVRHVGTGRGDDCGLSRFEGMKFTC